MKKPTVFISYSHANSKFVNGLADRLKTSGVDVWIDKWKIKVGDSITGRIEEGIGASDFLILVLSNASVNSKWVREELNSALIRNVEQEKHAFILPILIEDCELPSLLRHRRYADFRDDSEQAFQELLEVIQPGADSISGHQPFEPEMILPPAKGVRIPIPEEIVEAVEGQSCVLFLGPLASAPSPQGSRYEYSQAPPSSTELSWLLAVMCAYPYEDVTNLQNVSLFFQSQPSGSRQSLVQAIEEEMIGPEILPSPLLHMLAALPFPIVITTSYDNLFDIALSRAYTRDGRPKQPVVRIYDPTRGVPESVSIDPTEERPILLKLFGDIGRPESLVVTEEDLMGFQQFMTDTLRSPIHRNIQARLHTWLTIWIGYTLADYSLRLLVRALRGMGVLVEPSPDSRLVQVWQDRVDLFRENLWDFVPSLYEQVLGVEYQPDSPQDEPGREGSRRGG